MVLARFFDACPILARNGDGSECVQSRATGRDPRTSACAHRMRAIVVDDRVPGFFTPPRASGVPRGHHPLGGLLALISAMEMRCVGLDPRTSTQSEPFTHRQPEGRKQAAAFPYVVLSLRHSASGMASACGLTITAFGFGGLRHAQSWPAEHENPSEWRAFQSPAKQLHARFAEASCVPIEI